MSEPEQPSKALPVNENVVFKLLKPTSISTNDFVILDSEQSLYGSTKEFVDKVVQYFFRQPKRVFGKRDKSRNT